MKLKFEMTPRRRLNAVYWLGTFQAIIAMVVFQSFQEGEQFPTFVYALLVIAWVIIGVAYANNTSAFNKETLWMTIKNPAKVTREADDVLQHHVHPNGPGRRPRPACKPPKPTLPSNKTIGP